MYLHLLSIIEANTVLLYHVGDWVPYMNTNWMTGWCLLMLTVCPHSGVYRKFKKARNFVEIISPLRSRSLLGGSFQTFLAMVLTTCLDY